MECLHMSGAGNDFMVLDARGKSLDFSALAKKLCAVTGADGFMAVDNSNVADFRLHFYNSDGSRGEMCGNGARCICKFSFDHGIAGPHMTVETDAGIVPGERLAENQYRVALNLPSVLDLNRKPGVAYVELGNPGVPHAVTEYQGLTFSRKEELRQFAYALRHDPVFPKGANANLYTFLSPERIRILTFERGVEDYTLACGTGSGSTAAVLWTKGLVPGNRLEVENQGGTLTVTMEGENGILTALFLERPAENLGKMDVSL